MKSGKQCLGYRDENDMIFKDETAVTVRRAKTSRNDGARGPTQSSTRQDTSEALTPSNSSASPPSNLGGEGAEAEEAAIVKGFIEKFVTPASKADAAQGPFPAAAKYFAKAKPGSPVIYATQAIALAGVSHLRKSEAMNERARYRYGQAMRKVSDALNTPETAQLDEILICMLLFVIIGCFIETSSAVPQWLMHHRAAELLIRQRGRTIAKSEASMDLMMRLRLPLAVSHAVQAMPVQDFVDDNDPNLLSWSDIPTELAMHPTNTLNSCLLPVGGLRSRAENVLTLPVDATSLVEVTALINDCLKADENLVFWTQSVSDATIPWSIHDLKNPPINDITSLGPCPGLTDILSYTDVWTANRLHTVRCFRAFLMATILRCAAWLTGDSVESMTEAQREANLSILGFHQLNIREIFLEQIHDICRSVLYVRSQSRPPLFNVGS
jgi:hypothetical protein